MKRILALTVLSVVSVLWVACPAPAADQYKAGQFSVSPFAGLTVSKFKPLSGRQFAGLGVGYHLTDAIAVTGEAAATDHDERAIDQFGAHAKSYLPIFKTGLALYGELGYQRFTRERLNFMSTGAGVELRAKRFGAFAGARVLEDFSRPAAIQLLLGANIRF